MDKTIAHLGFIQGVINRMGNNSFLVKGWTVTLVAAIFALSAKDANEKFIFIALFPILVFWFLDSYYLYQENLFRELYEKVADGRITSDYFTMNTKQVQQPQSKSFMRIAFSFSIFPFYLLILVLLVFLAIQCGFDFGIQKAIQAICQ